VEEQESVRVDKWLWAVRLYKTRAQATSACRLGRVTIGPREAKASRELRPGEVVAVQKDGMTRSVKVLQVLQKRVGAGKVCDYFEELTSEEEWEKARAARDAAKENRVFDIGGIGRPTKKYRRQIEEFLREHGGG
jgi:ribosome-associated heat shock protein Hsp15